MFYTTILFLTAERHSSFDDLVHVVKISSDLLTYITLKIPYPFHTFSLYLFIF